MGFQARRLPRDGEDPQPSYDGLPSPSLPVASWARRFLGPSLPGPVASWANAEIDGLESPSYMLQAGQFPEQVAGWETDGLDRHASCELQNHREALYSRRECDAAD